MEIVSTAEEYFKEVPIKLTTMRAVLYAARLRADAQAAAQEIRPAGQFYEHAMYNKVGEAITAIAGRDDAPARATPRYLLHLAAGAMRSAYGDIRVLEKDVNASTLECNTAQMADEAIGTVASQVFVEIERADYYSGVVFVGDLPQ